MKKEKFDQLVRNLKSQDEGIALRAIEDIRKDGDPEILPVLAKLLYSSDNDKMKAGIRGIFYDLKDPRAAETLVEIIGSQDFSDKKTFFVSTCWESKVDYTAHLSFFVDLLLNEEMPTAIEALTVIEEMLGPFEELELEENIDKIHEYLDFPTNDNEALATSLLEILQRHLDNITEEERFN